ncbi:hypothetical protein [Hymenobacter terrestris]|uniref:Uncharacterized protein n=1 Tax=Hymenobacter terrestris TaxID=2748310 RepID=A0ABX2PZJ2_9BACT|nr:hypothetical protein [Hymenobacter terrestris]NVO83591.1 hypothetical protein [Hymenobacter terrestris]
MSTATLAPDSSSSSRRRRRTSSYTRLEKEKKSEKRANYITAGILGAIALALLISLGVIAFNAAS